MAPDRTAPTVVALQEEIRASGAEVSLYYRDLASEDSILLDPDVRMHAASTMKVPVLIQLFRDADEGRLELDEAIPVTTRFRSVLDGSPYELDMGSDSDSTLYRRVGQGVSHRALAELMITVSSNLATNLLIERVGAGRVTATMRSLGADSIDVLRGVEDIPAFRAGLVNSTTARDLGVILTALARGQAASPEATREMIGILSRQRFGELIPGGLPPGTRIAHKTGWITGIEHDAAIVYAGEGEPYVLVVLTRGIEDRAAAARLVGTLSRIVYEHHQALRESAS